MKKSRKKIIIIALITTLLGGILFTIGFLTGGAEGVYVDFKGIHVGALQPYEEKKEELEAFENIDLDLSFTDYEIVLSDHYGIEIEGRGSRIPVYELKQGTLKVRNLSSSGFQLFNLEIGFNKIRNHVKIYLPEDAILDKVTLESDFSDGEVFIKEVDQLDVSLSFATLHYEGTTRNLTLETDFSDMTYQGEIDNKIDINLDFGNFYYKTSQAKDYYNYEVNGDFSDFFLDRETYQNYHESHGSDHDVNIKMSFGDVYFYFYYIK